MKEQFDFIYYDMGMHSTDDFSMKSANIMLRNIIFLLKPAGNFMVVCNWMQYNMFVTATKHMKSSSFKVSVMIVNCTAFYLHVLCNLRPFLLLLMKSHSFYASRRL